MSWPSSRALMLLTEVIKLIFQNRRVLTTIPILEKVEGREYYGRSATQIEGKVSIQKNSEQGLAAFIYGKDGLSTTPIQNIEQGEIDQQNDYIYFISFQFSE